MVYRYIPEATQAIKSASDDEHKQKLMDFLFSEVEKHCDSRKLCSAGLKGRDSYCNSVADGMKLYNDAIQGMMQKSTLEEKQLDEHLMAYFDSALEYYDPSRCHDCRETIKTQLANWD